MGPPSVRTAMNRLVIKYSRFNDLLRDLAYFAGSMAYIGPRSDLFISRFTLENLESVPRSARLFRPKAVA
jgi:hypothetical protein